MASGVTITDTLADSLPDVVTQARIEQEHRGVMTQLVDRVRLGTGVGNDWKEISLAQLTAQAITETTEEKNPQQLEDTPFRITPSMISVHTIITDRVARNISKNVFARTGRLGQNAIERKKEQDALVTFSGATTQLGGAGVTLTSGVISAAKARISAGNVTEPWHGPVAFVLHEYQMKDLEDELTAGVGTYPVPQGATADVFRQGFMLPIGGATGFTANLIQIDGSDDAVGGVFASGRDGAIVLVQARAPWVKTIRAEKLGGGATEVLHRDEYAYGERSAGNWLLSVKSDATQPTS